MTYEFITPSDAITFVAPDDKVAFVCALVLGRGKAFCKREDGVDLDTCVLFRSEADVETIVRDALGCGMPEFMESRWGEVADAFDTFAYGSFEDRRQYDDAVAAITDPEKLAEFKAKHEDRRRTSMSEWVRGAWDLAKSVRKDRGGRSRRKLAKQTV